VFRPAHENDQRPVIIDFVTRPFIGVKNIPDKIVRNLKFTLQAFDLFGCRLHDVDPATFFCLWNLNISSKAFVNFQHNSASCVLSPQEARQDQATRREVNNSRL
jgi:hypothetical protein